LGQTNLVKIDSKPLLPTFQGLDLNQGGRTRPGQYSSPQQQQREQIMPAGEMLFVIGFIIAFGIFAVVLGWGERRTRHLNH
jgi:hypothetical protein